MRAAERAYLFVPANRMDRVGKAIQSGTDAVIIDLEDAVPPEDKPGALEMLVQGWSSYSEIAARNNVTLVVRINAVGTPWHHEEVRVAKMLDVGHVVIPKATDPAMLSNVALMLPEAFLYPLLETAEGFHRIAELARAPGVGRLLLGTVDLMVDLGISCDDVPLHYYRSLIVNHSRCAGLPAPVDGVCLDLHDSQRLQMEVRRARDFGFGAKMVIHPKHAKPAMLGFAPAEAEVLWARRVLEAAGTAQGRVIAVDGKMVDLPVLRRAEAILAR